MFDAAQSKAILYNAKQCDGMLSMVYCALRGVVCVVWCVLSPLGFSLCLQPISHPPAHNKKINFPVIINAIFVRTYHKVEVQIS